MTTKIRIGLIVPANNTVIEPEFYSLGLSGITFHSTRIAVSSESEKGLLKMLKGVRDAVRSLSACKPDAIAYCCLSSSFIKGSGWDEALGKKIERASKVPTVTAATAMLKALRHLRLRRVSTLSGYGPSINNAMKRYLSENGFKVVRSVGLGLSMHEVGDYPPEEIYNRSKRLFDKNVDGLFIGSTDLQAMPVIERLERRLKKPVVTVNQALLKYSLQAAGLKISIGGFGRLLREPTVRWKNR